MFGRWQGRLAAMAVLASALLVSLDAPAQQAAPQGAKRNAAQAPDGEKPSAPVAAKVDDTLIVARVNGKPIRVADVRLALAAVLRGRQIDPRTIVLLQAEVLAQLIDRQLVEKALADRAVSPKSETVDAAIERFKGQTPGQMTFADFLKQQGLTEQSLRLQIAWQLTWSAYLDEQITDEVLEDYFREHHKQFDGTELRASHILLRPLQVGDEKQTAQLIKKANDLREQIESGKISFEAAAKQYSDGPSKSQGGDVGYFPRNGVMEESFSRAAFALEKGAVSTPVTSSFGVHLIRITGEKPGEKDWNDVREQLKAPVSQQLFSALADKGRAAAKIEFNPQMPHFKPGTRELEILKPGEAGADKKSAADKPAADKAVAKKSPAKKSAAKKD